MRPPPPPPPMGGAPTVTDAVAAVDPPGPVQVSVNDADDVTGGEASVPEVGREPLQAPDAVQAVAFCEVQFKVLVAPELTDSGLAEKPTVGAAGVGATPSRYVPAFSKRSGRAMKLTL